MAHSNLRRHQLRSPRRTVVWNQGPGSATVTAFSSNVTTVLGLGQTSLGGVTVVRLRGSLQAFLRSGDAGGVGFHCALGVGIVTQDAFSVGVTAMPNPQDDTDWKWLYHRIFDLHTLDATIANSYGPAGLAAIQFEVDSKAMRKMVPNQTIFASLQVVEAAAATMDVYFDSRMLLKLS